uniref:Anaphase-promoting complex subunit 4 WD40 domain-containing protein n=1 Tax=Globisporangium ultimum (strain ATCC 200006 / CBS 805.95 / DAOM BR144) TaxID=431595 RepID=K3WJZ4_GLOUD
MLQHFQQKHNLSRNTLHNGAIHHIEFSHDAKCLATSGQDKVAQVCKLPFSRFRGETGSVFIGHDNAVRSIHWSHNNQMVVTTSMDKSARVWLADSDVTSLAFHGVPPASASPGKIKSSGSATRAFNSSSAKKVTKQEIVDAMFFYMDKFIVSGCGNAIRLHQFELDELHARAQTKKAKKNDILVEENKSRKKKVAEWTIDAMQSLTALTCVNGSFLSSVIIAAGSDRSLRILDAAVGGKTLRVISDAHVRAAHTVALPKASCFTSHPSNFYDLLLSSAPNSTIHLWDIRADNCVMRFGEHVNRVHPLGVAFSPCMRYVATGSEDRTTYLYDIRKGRCLRKLTGHTDVVTCVAFNPLYPQLATSSYDGTIRFYSDTDGT